MAAACSGAIGVLSLGFAMVPLEAAAAGPAAPGVTPVHPGRAGYFDYTLAPGASTTGALIVQNRSQSAATYDLYAADATTSPVGGVAYGQADSSAEGAAGWLRLSTSEASLAPGQRTTLTFSVAVPRGATPGQHVAAIGAQTPSVATSPTRSNGGSISLITSSRVVVAVLVDVPGPATVGFTVGRPRVEEDQHVRQLISIPIADTGGLLARPVLSGLVYPCGASPAAGVSLRRQLDTFVPGTSIDYPWYLDTVLPVGCYLAKVEVVVDGKGITAYSGDIQVGSAQAAVAVPGHLRLPWTLPLPFAAGDVLLLASVALLGLVLRQRRRRAMHFHTS